MLCFLSICFQAWTKGAATKCRAPEQILCKQSTDKAEEKEGKSQKKNKFTAVWNHHDESFSFEGFGLMFNTVVFVTSLVNASSSSLICSIAVVLISLRPSPRLPLSCVASLLGHMM